METLSQFELNRFPSRMCHGSVYLRSLHVAEVAIQQNIQELSLAFWVIRRNSGHLQVSLAVLCRFDCAAQSLKPFLQLRVRAHLQLGIAEGKVRGWERGKICSEKERVSLERKSRRLRV